MSLHLCNGATLACMMLMKDCITHLDHCTASAAQQHLVRVRPVPVALQQIDFPQVHTQHGSSLFVPEAERAAATKQSLCVALRTQRRVFECDMKCSADGATASYIKRDRASVVLRTHNLRHPYDLACDTLVVLWNHKPAGASLCIDVLCAEVLRHN